MYCKRDNNLLSQLQSLYTEDYDNNLWYNNLLCQLQTLYTEEAGAPEVEIDLDEVNFLDIFNIWPT